MTAKNETRDDLDSIRHSLAHLLAAAVLERFPETKLGIGPVIEHGFYYDFEFKKPLDPKTLPEIESRMRELAEMHLPFSGETLTAAVAKNRFADQPFKLELIGEFAKEKKSLTAYHTGDGFTDLCRGGHVTNTSEINPEGFTLTHTAGAYWRGDEKNPMLTRIYGLAFYTKAELDAHLAMLEEARKRDHKVVGPELDLFTFSPLVGAGLPLFTPRGTLVRNLLDDFVWQLREAAGYERVDIPHITKKELYETSGHWDKFKNELFRITTREGHEFAMKPMNCPHHAQIYARKAWSYRELPQRYASTTKVYRDEQTGELAGLARVRSITQDDAHVFCRMEHIEGEMERIWEIVNSFYTTFGFDLEVHLSFHDPEQFKKYLGSPTVWEKAEAAMERLAKKRLAGTVQVDIGEAAFYGPKIDFLAQDALGRKWQVATIQLDMNQPERFDLTCMNETGDKERIFMIHAAIMGSIERFLAMLLEHTAGRLPFWLSPVQARVLAVSGKFQSYADEVSAALGAAGIRTETADTNETLGKRIREAELTRIPYALIVGEREANEKSASVRHLTRGDEGSKEVAILISAMREEVRARK